MSRAAPIGSTLVCRPESRSAAASDRATRAGEGPAGHVEGEPRPRFVPASLSEALVKRLDGVRRSGPAGIAPEDFRLAVRDVVVVASSSRGGSSLLAEILRRVPGLLHLSGEMNPFFRLAGLSYPDSGAGSDALGPEHLDGADRLDRLSRELALDCGRPAPGLDLPGGLETFVADLTWRVICQWPRTHVSAPEVEQAARETLSELRSAHGWQADAFPEPAMFHALFLKRLRGAHPGLSSRYYDLPPELLARLDPELPAVEGVAAEPVVEEPPFICIVPRTPPGPGELANATVVLKTPSNVYRLTFLKRFFPAARFRILHLTRNAAASINGLYDGWRHLGFHSHRSGEPLDIEGYTDLRMPWTRWWWKFDLPPGWTALRSRPLTEVCAHQWASAHRAVRDFLAGERVDTHRLRFEDVADEGRRQRAIEQMVLWLGAPWDDRTRARLAGGLPVIMATEKPRNRRWVEKARLLEPVLASPAVRETMEWLGYDPRPETWT